MAEDLLEDIYEEGAAGEGAEDTAESKPGKFGFIRKLFAGKKKLVIIILILLVLLGAGAGAWFFFFQVEMKKKKAAEAAAKALEEKPEEIIFEDIVALEPFERIRLRGSSSMSLISLGVSLELSDHRYRRQIHASRERIRKIIISKMGESTWLVLRSPEGKLELKYELLRQINSSFPKIMVRNLYFTNFIMQ